MKDRKVSRSCTMRKMENDRNKDVIITRKSLDSFLDANQTDSQCKGCRVPILISLTRRDKAIASEVSAPLKLRPYGAIQICLLLLLLLLSLLADSSWLLTLLCVPFTALKSLIGPGDRKKTSYREKNPARIIVKGSLQRIPSWNYLRTECRLNNMSVSDLVPRIATMTLAACCPLASHWVWLNRLH